MISVSMNLIPCARHTSCIRCNSLCAFSCDYHGIWSSPQSWMSLRSARVYRKRRADSRRRTRPADTPYEPYDTDEWYTLVDRDRSRDRSADHDSRSRKTDRKDWWSVCWHHPRTSADGPRDCVRACRALSRCCKCSHRRPRMAVGAQDLWKTLGNVMMLILANHSRRGFSTEFKFNNRVIIFRETTNNYKYLNMKI